MLWGAAVGVWGLSVPMLEQTKVCYSTPGCDFGEGTADKPICSDYTPEFIYDRRLGPLGPDFCKGYAAHE